MDCEGTFPGLKITANLALLRHTCSSVALNGLACFWKATYKQSLKTEDALIVCKADQGEIIKQEAKAAKTSWLSSTRL
jgi:hypothetical protein